MMSDKIVKIESEITEEFITDVCSRLSEGLQVRRTLPGHGRLHIDRKLPFLCIYRRRVSKFNPDNGTDQLIKGEASYLVVPSGSKHKKGISSLLRAVIKTLSEVTGAFLIIEIWSRQLPVSIIDPENVRTAPSFRIFVPPDRIPVETIESLEKALTRIIVSKNRGIAETVYSNRPWPEKLPSLISQTDIEKFNCFQIGLEVTPIYRDPESFEIYPFVLKRIHQGISKGLKQSAFEFSLKRTTVRPATYKSLGRRAVVKAVWEVDHKLAEISNEFDFLLLVTPVNIEQSWNQFKKCRFDCGPVFYYRPINIDPSVLKRKLYNIPFDRIEDPTLSSIFHNKLVELERKFSMLRDRNTRNFLHGSVQLFGEIDDEIFRLADRVLDKLSPRSHEFSGSNKVNASFFAERANMEINRFREIYPGIESRVIIRDDITGLMVLRGNLNIGKRVKIPGSRVEALIQHEVGTHVLTYINGRYQPFQQLYCGLAGSDELQEGLAVLSEYLVGGLSRPRLRLLAGRVVAVKMLLDGATFIETFRELHYKFAFSMRPAYIITARIYRSGGFTKDAVYLRGLMNLLKYLRDGGDLVPLFIGKISIGDVPLINELQLRKVLKPTLLKPAYFDTPQSVAKLNEIKNGAQIFKLI